MDIVALTTFLSPFLPFLMKLGDKAMESEAGQFGEDAWIKAKAIWKQLGPKVEAKEDAKDAAEKVAAKPGSDARKALFQEELIALFDENPNLKEMIGKILQEQPQGSIYGTRISQEVAGNQNQVIGYVSGGQVLGNISGSVSVGTSLNHSASDGETPASLSSEARKLTKTVLILTANPKGTSRLRLDEETREIQSGLERSRWRDNFIVEQRWAVRPNDIRRAILDCKPDIIHFSGHGGAEEGLVLEDEVGSVGVVSAEALKDLFGLFAKKIECVVLNACYSQVQAVAISQHIPYVIGMSKAIGDRAAIEFATGFYDALGSGESIDFAYKLGCNAIQMAGISEQLTPTLERKTI